MKTIFVVGSMLIGTVWCVKELQKQQPAPAMVAAKNPNVVVVGGDGPSKAAPNNTPIAVPLKGA